jgi:hypothetical protein
MPRKRKSVQVCVMPGCENAAVYKSAKICHACYAFMHYWKDRSVTDRMQHVHKIDRWSTRAHSVLLPEKVETLGPKRRGRPARRKAG